VVARKSSFKARTQTAEVLSVTYAGYELRAQTFEVDAVIVLVGRRALRDDAISTLPGRILHTSSCDFGCPRRQVSQVLCREGGLCCVLRHQGGILRDGVQSSEALHVFARVVSEEESEMLSLDKA
jgi:hypothetical protein